MFCHRYIVTCFSVSYYCANDKNSFKKDVKLHLGGVVPPLKKHKSGYPKSFFCIFCNLSNASLFYQVIIDKLLLLQYITLYSPLAVRNMVQTDIQGVKCPIKCKESMVKQTSHFASVQRLCEFRAEIESKYLHARLYT